MRLAQSKMSRQPRIRFKISRPCTTRVKQTKFSFNMLVEQNSFLILKRAMGKNFQIGGIPVP